jgi:5-methylcytosine-specific restriction endonuclease McrA
MRKISIQESDRDLYSDVWQKWINDCDTETKAAIATVARGEKIEISKRYKQKEIKEKYFISKNAPFYGRCAYCEAPIADFQFGDIEHFRPKKGVKDADGKIIYFKDDRGDKILDKAGKPIPHSGYYWLAYEWTNLLPTCQVCNRPKNTCFPVIGNHAQSPGDEAKEQPLLINPISDRPDDDPEKHLAVDPETGTMFALNNSDRGLMCIKIFNLNQRDQLKKARKGAIESTNNLLVEIGATHKELADPRRSQKDTYRILIEKYDQLIKIWEGKEAYTSASRSYLKEKGFTTEWLSKKYQTLQEDFSKAVT